MQMEEQPTSILEFCEGVCYLWHSVCLVIDILKYKVFHYKSPFQILSYYTLIIISKIVQVYILFMNFTSEYKRGVRYYF